MGKAFLVLHPRYQHRDDRRGKGEQDFMED